LKDAKRPESNNWEGEKKDSEKREAHKPNFQKKRKWDEREVGET